MSALAGLLAGYVVTQIAFGVSTTGRWVFPIVAAVLAYALVSAVFVFLVADLVVQPKPPTGHFPHTHR
jgi:hypothetical protein